MTQDEKVDAIYNAVVGNESLRQKGLIERVEKLEKKASVIDQAWAKVTGGVLVLSIIGTGLVAFLSWVWNKIGY